MPEQCTITFYTANGLGEIVFGYRADRWNKQNEPIDEGDLHLTAISAVCEVYVKGDIIEDGDTDQQWLDLEQFKKDCEGMVKKPRQKAIS